MWDRNGMLGDGAEEMFVGDRNGMAGDGAEESNYNKYIMTLTYCLIATI